MRIVSLLLAVVLILTSNTGKAQDFDLQLLNTAVPSIVVMGQMVPVSGDIRNNGPNTYIADSGKITMNVHASYDPIAPADTFDLVPITTFDIEVDSLQKDQVISYNGEFLADNFHFRTGHSGITVIIWPKLPPVGDSVVRNHFFATKVSSVDSARVTSLASKLEATQVQLYPNPATEWVQIEMPEAREGTLTLLNLQGQELTSISVDRQHHSYQLSIEELEISTGVYLLSFEGESLNWSKKLIIRKH